MGERIAIMNNGVFEQIGDAIEVYDRPASLFVAQFLGSPQMNVVSARARSRRRDGDGRGRRSFLELPATALPPGTAEVQVGFRPEAVQVRAKDGDPGVRPAGATASSPMPLPAPPHRRRPPRGASTSSSTSGAT